MAFDLSRKLILASTSPRRLSLLDEAGVKYYAISPISDESWPPELDVYDVPEYLAKEKAESVKPQITDQIVLAADTVVILEGQILGKPANKNEGIKMLRQLSGKMHEVVTGVCILDREKIRAFSVTTKVHFTELSDQDIMYYLDEFKPYDKAGSYAIQEWIGKHVSKVEGDFNNVVGLPVERVLKELMSF